MSGYLPIGGAGGVPFYQPTPADLERLEEVIMVDCGPSESYSIIVRAVATRLNDVMKKAIDRDLIESSSYFHSHQVDGVVVSGFGNHLRMTINCPHCTAVSRGPTKFTLQNHSTKEKIELIEHTWHNITYHGDFGSELDPKLLCRVLGFV